MIGAVVAVTGGGVLLRLRNGTLKGGILMSLFNAFLKDESGASAAEYVLLLAIIGAGIIAGVSYLGESINTALTTAGDALTGFMPTDAS